MIRTKGEAGTGDVVEAVRHARQLQSEIDIVHAMWLRRKKKQAEGGEGSYSFGGCQDDELYAYAKSIGADYNLVCEVGQLGRLPVVTFAAGGIATPADAALMMHLGMDGVFVGSVRKRWMIIIDHFIHYW